VTGRGRVVVVGLGPGGVDLLLPAARAAIETVPTRFARTTRHPAVEELAAAGIRFEGFDEQYERGADYHAVYGAIVDALVESAAAHGEVLYAVPGNPEVAERTVALLREQGAQGAIDLQVIPGLSFIDLAWSRLGVDPMRDGAHVVDAQEFGAQAAGRTGPLLIGHCIDRFVLSEVKLALLDVIDAEHEVVVLQRLGLPDESITRVVLAELDREIEPDHLTSVFVDLGDRSPAREYVELLELAARLRGPGGCPWDAEQTHHSLTRYLLEEAYEVVEAVESLPFDAPGGSPGAELPAAYARLEDELGDLLYQIVFHALLAEEAGAFTMSDVARGIHDKLVRRHPHVFADVEAENTEAVMRNWEQIKKDEKGERSIVAGITPGLPSLLYAHKLYRKAASIGLEPGTAVDAIERLSSVTNRLGAVADDDVERVLGDLLAAAVVFARARGIDAESSLRAWSTAFRTRFEAMEHRAHERGIDLSTAGSSQVLTLWDETTTPD